MTAEREPVETPGGYAPAVAAQWGRRVYEAAADMIAGEYFQAAAARDVGLREFARLVGQVPPGVFAGAKPGPFAPFSPGQADLVAALSALGRNGLSMLLMSCGTKATDLPPNELRPLMAAALEIAACPVRGGSLVRFLCARGVLVRTNGGA